MQLPTTNTQQGIKMSRKESFPIEVPDTMRSDLETKNGQVESPGRYSAKRSFHHVNFFCDAPGASHVYLVGDFNRWDTAATPMLRTPDGRWMADLELHHGHHRYLFIVDGQPKLDPSATGIVRNERNERVSLIAVS